MWILSRFCCPICSRSVIDMSKTWQRLDEEVSLKSIVESFKYDRSCKLVAEEYQIVLLVSLDRSDCYAFRLPRQEGNEVSFSVP